MKVTWTEALLKMVFDSPPEGIELVVNVVVDPMVELHVLSMDTVEKMLGMLPCFSDALIWRFRISCHSLLEGVQFRR